MRNELWTKKEQERAITKNWQAGNFGDFAVDDFVYDFMSQGTAHFNPKSTEFNMNGFGNTQPMATPENPIYWPTVAQYSSIIEKYAKQFDIPPNIIGNIIYKESSGRANAFNEDGGQRSRGLMQITEPTAKLLGFKEDDFDKLFDPDTNIYYGVKLLAQYRDMELPFFDKDTSIVDKWATISSAYNQGPIYGLNALKKLQAMGKPTTWENVLWYMTNHTASNGKQPYTKYAEMYGPFVVSNFDWSSYLLENKGKVGLGVLAVAAIAGFFIFNYFSKKEA